MSLHNDIMNLQVIGNKSGLYKVGHKDARHAAAKLSLKYESALEEATEALQNLSENADDENVKRFASYCLCRLEIILEG